MRFIHQGTFKVGSGEIVSGGTVTVYLAGTTTLATIYTALTGGSADSDSAITSGTDGHWLFYVDEADYLSSQKFKYTLSYPGFTSKPYDDIIIFPNDNNIKTIVTKTTTYTALLSDDTILADGTFTITLPAVATTTGKIYEIKNINASGTITISPNVDGASLTIAAGVTSHIQSDGTIYRNLLNKVSGVITNANLTGGVTSVGNAATVITNANLTGDVTSVGNAATVITNANLTGDVTSVGNAATLAITRPTIQALTATATWTRPTGCKKIKVTLVGGGGGGAAGDSDTNGAGGGGGGGGGAAVKFIDVSAISSVAVTVGTGGAGGATTRVSGTVGVTTSWGAVFTATGGAGGLFATPGGVGGVGASGDFNIKGSAGNSVVGVANGIGSNGGSSHMGGGGRGWGGGGDVGGVYGGGGAGGGGGNVYGGGGAGAGGICVVEEYY